jgi:cytidine deaminase
MRPSLFDLLGPYGLRSDVASTISPCGLCRQVIREFCALDMPVYLVPADYPQASHSSSKPTSGIGTVGEGGVRETTLGELLPDSFGPEHLDLPRG